MSFQIGDKVIHATHGFAEIMNIEAKVVAGIVSDYYVVKTSTLRLWIPINGANGDTLRSPTSKTNFNTLYNILRSHRLPFSENRNERRSQVLSRAHDGATESTCSLIRDLSFCRKNRKLNEFETVIYKRAVNNLIEEWKYAMSISQVQANLELNLLLDESYTLSLAN
jgi:RNA polymerase-interacting CarD/CdnL/TRCF family regulator